MKIIKDKGERTVFSHTDFSVNDGELNKITTKFPFENELSNILIDIGIIPKVRGYSYLRYAVGIAVYRSELSYSVTKTLYPCVAKYYGTTAISVERAIRHAIETSFNNGKIGKLNEIFGMNIYGAGEKPTNSELIALLADRLILEGARKFSPIDNNL